LTNFVAVFNAMVQSITEVAIPRLYATSHHRFLERKESAQDCLDVEHRHYIHATRKPTQPV
jgi:hypothetical protein